MVCMFKWDGNDAHQPHQGGGGTQHSSLSPEEAEQKVREEWKLREIKRVEAAKHARTIEQRLAQAREAAQAALSKPTVVLTETRPVSASDLTSVPGTRSRNTTVEPAAKRRRVDSIPDTHSPGPTTSTAGASAEQAISDAALLPAMSSCHCKDDEGSSLVSGACAPAVTIKKRSLPPTVLPDELPSAPASRVMPSRSTRNSKPDYGAPKPKKNKSDAADKYVACELCGEWTCDGVSDRMLICDGCDKYYHRKCLELSHMPGEQWLCDNCIHKGLRLEIMCERAGRNDSNSPRLCTPIKFAPKLEKQDRTPAERDWAKNQPFQTQCLAPDSRCQAPDASLQTADYRRQIPDSRLKLSYCIF